MPTVSVTLLANIAGFISPLKAATQAAKDLRTELSHAAAAGKLDAVASSALKAGLALSGGFLLATTAAARFEKQMSEVDAVTGATAGEMDALSQAALQAGKDTVFSATQAAKAEAELAKAGLSTAEILGGALDGALALAAAGSLDLAEAADVAAKTMNVFRLKGKDVGHIADVLAAAANKSATDVHELGFALRMGGLAAKNAGLTLEDTVGTLAAFADSALIGSDGGTSFKTMLQALAAPSDEATRRMKELGIEAYDAGGNFVGIAKFAGNLQTKLKDLTQEQRNEALATIFGADAMRAATVLFGEGEQGIREYIAAVNDQGAAADVAAKKTDNLFGDVERLTGALESLFITSSSGANGGLRDLVQVATELVDMVSQIPAPVLSAGVIVTGLAGAGMLAFAAFVKARGAFAAATLELRTMGPAGARAATGITAVTRGAVRAGLAIGVLSVAAAGAAVAFGSELNPQMEAFAKGLDDWANRAIISGETARLLGDDLGKLDLALRNATSGGKGFASTIESWIPGAASADASWTKNIERIKALDQAMADLVQNGKGRDAAFIFAVLKKRAADLGISVEDLTKAFPVYAAAVEVSTGSTEELGGAASVARQDLKKLDDQMRETINRAFGLEEAEDRVAQAIADLTEQIKKQKQAGDEGAGSLIGQTQAARDNRAAVRDLVNDYQDLVLEYGEAGKSTDGLRKQLEDALVAMGFERAEVGRYVEALGLIPPEVTTKVKLEDEQALRDAQETHRELSRILNTQIAVTPRVYGPFVPSNSYSQNRWGGITEHAATGLLREAATFTPRSPARYAFAEPATQGEAFIPKSGDYGRAMSILSQAAGWYGATVSPGGSGGSGGGITVENLNVRAYSDRFSITQVMDDLALHGVH